MRVTPCQKPAAHRQPQLQKASYSEELVDEAQG
jgi:hypothetical protein